MADDTASYAANIAVRAFLTKFTEDHLEEVFGHRLIDGPYIPGGKEREDTEVWQNRMRDNQEALLLQMCILRAARGTGTSIGSGAPKHV